jgi:hypothetical protein
MNKNKKTIILYLIAGFIAACGVALIINLIAVGIANATAFIKNPLGEMDFTEVIIPAKAEATVNLSVPEKIVYYANIFGVDPDTALRIARCESNFSPKAENVNGSATGVYQFIRKTWKNNCEGDVYNEDANIICFVRMYPKHPEWWECR